MLYKKQSICEPISLFVCFLAIFTFLFKKDFFFTIVNGHYRSVYTMITRIMYRIRNYTIVKTKKERARAASAL